MKSLFFSANMFILEAYSNEEDEVAFNKWFKLRFPNLDGFFAFKGEWPFLFTPPKAIDMYSRTKAE